MLSRQRSREAADRLRCLVVCGRSALVVAPRVERLPERREGRPTAGGGAEPIGALHRHTELCESFFPPGEGGQRRAEDRPSQGLVLQPTALLRELDGLQRLLHGLFRPLGLEGDLGPRDREATGTQPFVPRSPALERPAAEASPAGPCLELIGWQDAQDPFEGAGRLLGEGRYAVTDQTWAFHLLGLQRAAPHAVFVPTTDALPLLRAVKDPHELAVLRAAGESVDACFPEILRVRFAGRRETDVAADLSECLRAHEHETVDFTIVGSGPN